MEIGIGILTVLYLSLLLFEAFWRWKKGEFSSLIAGLSLLHISLLFVVVWQYMTEVKAWQLSLFALAFLVLGILPQLEDFRRKQALSLKRHLVQFVWHLILFFLLFLGFQTF